jgi:tetratricopeptide (TPR) repeat protein
MKVKIIDRLYVIKLFSGLTVMLFILAFALNQSAWGAGTSSSSSSSKSESAAQKRERANEYFEEGKKLQEKWRYKEASKKYKRAVKIDPTYAEAYSNLGYTYRKQEKYDKAVSYYEKAIKLKPELAEAHEYLGEAYAEMGKFDLAEKELAILQELGSDLTQKLADYIEKMRKQKS